MRQFFGFIASIRALALVAFGASEATAQTLTADRLNVIDQSGQFMTAQERRSLADGLGERLTDPVSMQLRNLSKSKTDGIVCGEVNAKNRMGGYVGFVPFVAGVALPKATIVMVSREVVEASPEGVSQWRAKVGCSG